MALKTEEAIKIAEQIQEDILHKEDVSTLTIVRQYYSLVTLLKKEDEVEWALNELGGYSLVSKVPHYRKVMDTVDKERFAVISTSCGDVEGMMLSGNDYKLDWNNNRYRNPFDYCSIGTRNFYFILNTITNLIYISTQQILFEIKFGKFEFDIFEETRKVVDTELSKISPKAFEKLTEEYENLIKSESPLAFRKTALACRIVLKDFADAIYPASDKKIVGFDGKQHTLKDDDYINRIIARIQESTGLESEKEFMDDYLKYLESYLVSLNSMSNKGIHHENSKEYANRCLIYTYLVLGDIIRLLGKKQK